MEMLPECLLFLSVQAFALRQMTEVKMYELQILQIFLFVLAGFALPAVGMIGISALLQSKLVFGHNRPNPIKDQPYECGMKPLQEAHVQFDIRYYLYALLFIIFDIEIVFLIPWAIAAATPKIKTLGPLVAANEIAIFIGILAVGLTYAWKKGALKWE